MTEQTIITGIIYENTDQSADTLLTKYRTLVGSGMYRIETFRSPDQLLLVICLKVSILSRYARNVTCIN